MEGTPQQPLESVLACWVLRTQLALPNPALRLQKCATGPSFRDLGLRDGTQVYMHTWQGLSQLSLSPALKVTHPLEKTRKHL